MVSDVAHVDKFKNKITGDKVNDKHDKYPVPCILIHNPGPFEQVEPESEIEKETDETVLKEYFQVSVMDFRSSVGAELFRFGAVFAEAHQHVSSPEIFKIDIDRDEPAFVGIFRYAVRVQFRFLNAGEEIGIEEQGSHQYRDDKTDLLSPGFEMDKEEKGDQGDDPV